MFSPLKFFRGSSLPFSGNFAALPGGSLRSLRLVWTTAAFWAFSGGLVPAERLADSNDPGEDWNVPGDWESQAIPTAGVDYEVEGTVAGILRSPAGASPVFGGRSLSLRGPDVRLVLGHEGAATINGLSMQEAILVATRSAALQGDALTVEGVNGILIENEADLEIRSPLRGEGSIEVLGTFREDGSSGGGIRLSGVGSDHALDWILNGAGLRAVTPGVLGRGNLTLLQGRLDFDCHVSAPDSVLRIQGEGFHLTLDQQWLLGGLHVVANGEVIFELPAGTYTRDVLVNDVGFTEEMVSGEGLLVILDESSDSDGDGLLDAWEREKLGNLESDAGDDPDEDGLSNVGEFGLETDPLNADSDGDGLLDGAERRSGFFVSASNAGSDPGLADSDGDGLEDGEEVNQHETNPVSADSDGDGLTDREELVEHGTSPVRADSDGDGQDDRLELAVGTDPNDAVSSFSVLEIGRVGFEEGVLGGTNHPGGEELGWAVEVVSGSPQTVDTLEGMSLPDRQLLLHNAAMIWRSEVLPLRGFSHPTVRIDARVFQTSSGIENVDFIDLKVALSMDGGNTFSEEFILLSVEGTRTGASGGPRLPLEEVFSIDAPADGPLRTFASQIGDLPQGATHLQVVIEAANNSASERFLFDNIVIEGVSQIDPQLDSDGDGLTDLVEIQEGLNPEDGADADVDGDGDGLSNRRELELGTQWARADTDADGLGDGEEVATHGTDPLRRDTDADGLLDGEETAVHGTDPLLGDSDGDGYGDALEVRFQSDPTVADAMAPFGPPNASGFVWFEEASLAAQAFARELAAELPWTAEGQGVALGVIDALDGVTLPNQQFLLHGGTVNLTVGPLAVERPEDVIAAVGVRVYQTSSGIENNDTIDIRLQSSQDGGNSFPEEVVLFSVEGTRTGASGGDRTPLEDVLAIDAPADGEFVRVMSERGSVPAGTTHVRLVIDAANNSNSERFVFDDIAFFERPAFAPGQDTDNDGMPDSWEFDRGLDRASAADAEEDPDGDGLTNLDEFEAGADPRLVDTDGDGVSDGDEVRIWQTHPGQVDSDGDGLADGEELVLETDPTSADTDGDGFNDRLEIALGSNPTVANAEGTLGPEGAVAFTGFELAAPGDLQFGGSDVEMGWQAEATGDSGVRASLGGLDLPQQVFVLHNGSLSFLSDAVRIDRPETTVVSVGVRVYQESSGIESDDFIDLRLQVSADGESYQTLEPFLMIEGTRTGASGGDRTPLEEVLDVASPADGAMVTFTTRSGDVPAGTTHLRVLIEAQNNSNSEYFVFDDLVVFADGGGVVPGDRQSPRVTRVFLDTADGRAMTLEWESEIGARYRVDYRASFEATDPWVSLWESASEASRATFAHDVAAGPRTGFYRVVRLAE